MYFLVYLYYVHNGNGEDEQYLLKLFCEQELASNQNQIADETDRKGIENEEN